MITETCPICGAEISSADGTALLLHRQERHGYVPPPPDNTPVRVGAKLQAGSAVITDAAPKPKRKVRRRKVRG